VIDHIRKAIELDVPVAFGTDVDILPFNSFEKNLSRKEGVLDLPLTDTNSFTTVGFCAQ